MCCAVHVEMRCCSPFTCQTSISHVQTEWPFQQDVFPHIQFKLGLSYCFNRNCSLAYCPNPLAVDPAARSSATEKVAASTPVDTSKSEGVPGICALKTQPELMSWQEPRVTPDGATLLFMSHEQVWCSPQTSVCSVKCFFPCNIPG